MLSSSMNSKMCEMLSWHCTSSLGSVLMRSRRPDSSSSNCAKITPVRSREAPIGDLEEREATTTRRANEIRTSLEVLYQAGDLGTVGADMKVDPTFECLSRESKPASVLVSDWRCLQVQHLYIST